MELDDSVHVWDRTGDKQWRPDVFTWTFFYPSADMELSLFDGHSCLLCYPPCAPVDAKHLLTRTPPEDARKVLPDLPMSMALRRVTQIAQWTKRLKTLPADGDPAAS